MESIGFLGGSVVKESACSAETRVQSLGREDPLEKGMATHSSILALKIPWTGEPGGLWLIGSQSDSGPLCNVGSPWSWPTVLTASPTLINFISLSLCLLSGNSFPTRAHTMTD